MYLRPTTSSTNDTLLNYIYSNTNNYNNFSQQLASGKKLNRPSDDAMGAISVLKVNKELNQMEGYVKNIELAKNELSVVDTTFASLNKNLQRAYDISVAASNGTNSDEALSAYKTEIDEIIAGIRDLGNTKYNGKYLFAGTNTGTAPFAENPDGGITYTGTPSTGGYERSIEISEGIQETINVPGDKLLGSYDGAADTGSGVFATLCRLSDALGSTPPDMDTVRASMDNIQGDIKSVSNLRTSMGSVTNRLNMSKTSLDSNMTQLKAYRSGIQDVDYSEAITNMAMSQYALQATMAVAAQTSQISLLNYL